MLSNIETSWCLFMVATEPIGVNRFQFLYLISQREQYHYQLSLSSSSVDRNDFFFQFTNLINIFVRWTQFYKFKFMKGICQEIIDFLSIFAINKSQGWELTQQLNTIHIIRWYAEHFHSEHFNQPVYSLFLLRLHSKYK